MQVFLHKYVIDKDNGNYNREDVANSFNKFFVNFGPDLAGKIPDPGTSAEHLDTLIERNPSSIFLKAVDEKEILDIVKNVRKKSYFNDIDMTIVKKGY